MNWLESVNGGAVSKTDDSRAKVLTDARDEKLPVVLKEADSGVKTIGVLEFQPVKSPGIYEAEFVSKDDDLIFHFWPWGYHKADRAGERTPRFLKNFEVHLVDVMTNVFGEGRFKIDDDKDMGAVFVRCIGWGRQQFTRDLAIKACQKLHYALGGTDG